MRIILLRFALVFSPHFVSIRNDREQHKTQGTQQNEIKVERTKKETKPKFSVNPRARGKEFRYIVLYIGKLVIRSYVGAEETIARIVNYDFGRRMRRQMPNEIFELWYSKTVL